ncbi:hypothetical protein, partial [Roseobacter sinensis]
SFHLSANYAFRRIKHNAVGWIPAKRDMSAIPLPRAEVCILRFDMAAKSATRGRQTFVSVARNYS